jgi:hypothetical protein
MMEPSADGIVASKAEPSEESHIIAAVSPASRPRFIEETGVRMRWILIASGCLLQVVNTIIPYPFFAVMLVIAVLYNGSIQWLLRHGWVNFRILACGKSGAGIPASRCACSHICAPGSRPRRHASAPAFPAPNRPGQRLIPASSVGKLMGKRFYNIWHKQCVTKSVWRPRVPGYLTEDIHPVA